MQTSRRARAHREAAENAILTKIHQVAMTLSQLVEEQRGLEEPPSVEVSPFALREKVSAMIRRRRFRQELFPHNIFADPAWDMLLELFLAELEDRPVGVSSLSQRSNVPASTALRRISSLVEQGLIVRSPADGADKRRIHVTLTQPASKLMKDYFTWLGTL